MVVITSRFPYPLEKGDKLRIYQQIKQLSKHFEIHLISTNEHIVSQAQKDELNSFCKSIHIFPISPWQKAVGIFWRFFDEKPFQVGYFYHYTIQRKIDKLLKTIQPDRIYCQLIRSAEYVKNYHNCPKTIDYMDAFSKGMERRAKSASLLKRMIFQSEWKRLSSYENSIFEYFEHRTIISEQDKNYIFHKKKDTIQIVPNGVDELFFEKENKQKDTDIVFIGNMGYPPNITAVQFLVNNILPLLPTKTTVKIAGSSPTSEVYKLASDKVEITGYIDDIRDAYRSARLFVAPMFLGTGLQNKLLEAMALGIPCITTSLANNALGAIPEKMILIANTPEEFAQQIQRLLSDSDLYKSISQSAQDYISQHFTWETTTQKLIDLIRL